MPDVTQNIISIQQDPEAIDKLSLEELNSVQKELSNRFNSIYPNNSIDEAFYNTLFSHFFQNIVDQEELKVAIRYLLPLNEKSLSNRFLALNELHAIPLARALGEDALLFTQVFFTIYPYADSIPPLALPDDAILALIMQTGIQGTNPLYIPKTEHSAKYHAFNMYLYLKQIGTHLDIIESELRRYKVAQKLQQDIQDFNLSDQEIALFYKLLEG